MIVLVRGHQTPLFWFPQSVFLSSFIYVSLTLCSCTAVGWVAAAATALWDAQLLAKLVFLVTEEDVAKALLDTEQYCDVFVEFCAFLKTLGAVFGFVVSDVETKIDICREYCGKNDEYKSLLGGVEYETAQSITNVKTKPPSYSRTLLRLLRIMPFVSQMLRGFVSDPESDSASKIASAAYANTLKKHHGWFVQKTVGAALSMGVPERKSLIKRLCGDGDAAEGVAGVNRVCDLFEVVEAKITEVYDKNSLHELP